MISDVHCLVVQMTVQLKDLSASQAHLGLDFSSVEDPTGVRLCVCVCVRTLEAFLQPALIH